MAPILASDYGHNKHTHKSNSNKEVFGYGEQYICRVVHKRKGKTKGLHVGRMKNGACYYGYGGKEFVHKHEFAVLIMF